MNEDEEGDNSTVDSLATVLSGGTLVSIGKVLSLGFGFLTQIAMARLLTEADYGSVVLTLSIVNVVALVAKLGLDDGVSREFPHYEDDPAKASGVIRAGMIITATTGLLLGALVFLLSPLIAHDIFNDATLVPLLRVSAIAVPFIATSSVAVSLARGARDARVQAYVRQIFQPAIRLVFIGSLLLAGLGAVGAVSGQIAAIIVAALAAFYLTKKILPSFGTSPVPMYRPVLAFSLPLIAVQGMGFLNTNVDIYMVGYFLKSSQLGIYNIALQLGNMVTAILGTVGFLLPPMLTRLHTQGKDTEMVRTYQVLTKWMVILILPVFVVLFFASEQIISLFFGPSYAKGALALQILLIGKLFAIIMGLNGQALVALGRNRIVSYLVFCETAVNIVINYTLIPVIGFEGAAVGMAVSTIIGDILGVVVLYRQFGLHPFTSNILLTVFAVSGVGIVSYGVLWVLNFPTYWTVLVVGISYLPTIAIFAPEQEDEQLLTRAEKQMGYDLSVVRRVISTFR